MQAEREDLYQTLRVVDFDVAGNSLRAYYDADNKLVFVLDFFESDTKPNVLLVINPVGSRKWDDILMNDYGLDLETVRPKKDNKYQKLDIEYSGLAEYDDLLRAHIFGEDISGALANLQRFRDTAAIRAAIERRDDAELTANKARETIDKTQEKIEELQEKLKKQRSKLGALRANVGKEPTKQSASKILRAEAQIDSLTEKLNRAKKRLDKAKKRLATAQDEIDAAEIILGKLESKSIDGATLPMTPVVTDVSVVDEVPVPMNIEEDDDFEPKAEIMAEDDVKPLLDKDPNVLDERIAFKPVDFSEVRFDEDLPVVQQPNFVPDIPDMEEYSKTDDVDFEPPMLNVDESEKKLLQDLEDDDFKSQNMDEEYETEDIDSELLRGLAPLEVPKVPENTEDYFEADKEEFKPISTENVDYQKEPMSYEPIVPQPIVTENIEINADDNQDMPEIAVAPIDSGYRPVSPLQVDDEVEIKSPVFVQKGRKPTVVYYTMLLVLILLSVFTLWFYQKTADDVTPELAAKIQVLNEVKDNVEEESVVVAETVPVVEETVEEVIEEKPVVDLVEPDIVFDEAIVPEVVPVSEPEPIVLEEEPQPVVIEPTEELVEETVEIDEEPKSPFLSDQEVTLKNLKTEEEILKEKPVFGISAETEIVQPEVIEDVVVEPELPIVDVQEPVVQQVASEQYIDDVVEPDVPVVDFKEPVIQQVASEQYIDDVVEEPVLETEEVISFDEDPLQQIASEVIEDTEVEETCADGEMPDKNGCCNGEESVFVEGEPMCCVVGTDECFPPM